MDFKIGPFLKWAGGKTQLMERLKAHLPASYGRYYEPFIGAGALLLAVQPSRATINDTNEQLLNVYRQLKLDAEPVIDAVTLLDKEPCDTERYRAIRALYNEKVDACERDAECAALMIWLNKHCYNGLYRVNKRGFFNVPFNNKTSGDSIDAANLRSIGQYLRANDIAIRHGDFEAACVDVSEGDFVYFDSPYVPVNPTSNFTSYTKNGFSLDDHQRLATLFRRLDAVGAKVMLSNNDVPLVRELYEGYSIEAFPVRRAINRDASKRVGTEVIIKNY